MKSMKNRAEIEDPNILPKLVAALALVFGLLWLFATHPEILTIAK